MAKRQKFADTAGRKKEIKICPDCNEPIEHVLMVSSEPGKNGGSVKFKEEYLGICKCNRETYFK